MVPHGRDKSSSSAELREEVLEPRVFALHARTSASGTGANKVRMLAWFCENPLCIWVDEPLPDAWW